ncbi:MAG TPA: excinuclease ABC subunit UvrC [Dongiaceae bacterium]|nr:excinuclease ABC subunit UvrC [Dongiaceae bacterium]
MEPKEKAALLPEKPGVYLFRDAGGTVIYVGKARNLRNRVRSYFLESRWIDAKTGSLAREIADLETVIVENEREALALENQFIKKYRPKFNIMLRDDKSYPYIKFTASEKYPRVYFTRRVRKDGSLYFGPYFPASLARRILHFVHKRFLVPSCSVDLTRHHARPCLQYYIHRCLGPCVAGLTSDERYAEAARDARMFLEGRRHDLIKSLGERMTVAAEQQLFEQAAGYRDLLRTLEDIEERQRIAAAQGDDTDVLAYHAEPPLVAANLFHLRGGRVVDRREFYWEDLEAFDAGEFVPSLLKQLYLEADYLPKIIHVPDEFEDRELLEETLSERAGHKVEIHTPLRGPKRAVLDLVKNNAAHSFEQRFRVLKPTSRAISAALQTALDLSEEPERIECFDISHIQGSDTVASMVVWEKGRMKKGDYRKFIIRGEEFATTAAPSGTGSPLPVLDAARRQNDDFASMREVVTRRYRRLQEEKKPMPGLVLIDGGIGQLHAAAEALESLGITNQPLASIAKKEEILYVYGQENEPVVLERHSPVLHLVQQIRDESHRFAVTFHRLRRGKRQTKSALEEIPGIGQRTAHKLLKEFGSVAAVQRAGLERLSEVIPRKSAEKVLQELSRPSQAP